MSRARRLTVVVAAWVAPAAWILVAVFSGPSDGTTISPPTALLVEDRWGDTVTVTRAYGGTPLREGDLVSMGPTALGTRVTRASSYPRVGSWSQRSGTDVDGGTGLGSRHAPVDR